MDAGDRVICTAKNTSYLGYKGTVKTIYNDNRQYPIAVKLDKLCLVITFSTNELTKIKTA